MYSYYYVLSDRNKKYSEQLANSKCFEGNIKELLTQVNADKKFCRDEEAISYDFFRDNIESETVLYIKNNSDDKILGACSIDLDHYIIIYGICVPNNGIKGIGTLLLNKIKDIGKLINAESIGISAHPSVSIFYENNGFIVDDDHDDDDDEIGMTYNFEQTTETTREKGGTRKTKRETRKTKRETRKTKRETRKTKRRKKKTKKQKK